MHFLGGVGASFEPPHAESRTIELTTRIEEAGKPFFLLSANVCLELFFSTFRFLGAQDFGWLRKVWLSPSRRFDVSPKTELPSGVCMTSTRRKNGSLRLLLRHLRPSRSVIQRARSCWKIFIDSAKERKARGFSRLHMPCAVCCCFLLRGVEWVFDGRSAGLEGQVNRIA
jgi:hypothetical protein